jgi:hypothetical protein
MDAALHTLSLLREAIRRNMALKGVTAFNIQFLGSNVALVDLLSFEEYDASRPWKDYLQFCRHFLAPLAVLRYRGGLCVRFSSLWVDGFPLDLVSTLLPFRSKFSHLLLIHLHLHAKMQSKYSETRKAKGEVKKLSGHPVCMERISEFLEMAIKALHRTSQNTEWDDYNSDTSFTKSIAPQKMILVDSVAANSSGTLAIDMSSNTGEYRLAFARHFKHAFAANKDYLTVEQLYQKRSMSWRSSIITPLVFEAFNPSPCIEFCKRSAFSLHSTASGGHALGPRPNTPPYASAWRLARKRCGTFQPARKSGLDSPTGICAYGRFFSYSD